MKLSEITRLLQKKGFRKLSEKEVFEQNLDNTPKTYYKYRGDLNINIGGNVGFTIIAKKNDIGLGLWIWSDEEGNQHGTYWEELFLQVFMPAMDRL